MNETTTTTEATEKLTIPFPSHVTDPAPNKDVLPLSRELIETSRDLNNVFNSAGNVHKCVRTHFVNVTDGTYGIESLVAQILKSNGAHFPQGIETTEFRNIAIASSMFTDDVIAKVREAFGADRYPDSVIASYLAFYMAKETSKNRVGKVKLTKHEDATRTCPKPRTKYYLLDIAPIA